MRNSTLRLVASDHPGKRICRLCFGSPVESRQVDCINHVDNIYEFLPGQVFGIVWWKRDREDRQHWTLAVVEAVPRSHIGYYLPNLSSGVLVHAMLDQHGPAGQGGSVDRFLHLLEQLKQANKDPAVIAPIVYRMLSYQILLDQKYAITMTLQCLHQPHISNN